VFIDRRCVDLFVELIEVRIAATFVEQFADRRTGMFLYDTAEEPKLTAPAAAVNAKYANFRGVVSLQYGFARSEDASPLESGAGQNRVDVLETLVGIGIASAINVVIADDEFAMRATVSRPGIREEAPDVADAIAKHRAIAAGSKISHKSDQVDPTGLEYVAKAAKNRLERRCADRIANSGRKAGILTVNRRRKVL